MLPFSNQRRPTAPLADRTVRPVFFEAKLFQAPAKSGEDVTAMRFAIKTRPEHQTWEEIRDAWIAADEIPLFESAWNWDHFYPADRRPDRAELRGLDDAGRDGPGHPADQARLPGHRHGLPSPCGAGQHGGHRRHHLWRPAGTGPRRGLEPDGVRRLRDRIAAAARALRPVRRGRRGHHQAAEPDHHHVRRDSTSGSPRPGASRSRCSSHTRR